MFINAKVVHNKYGKGVITDLEINAKDQLKSLITVEFNDNVVKKFAMEAFKDNKFFTTDDEEIIPFVNGIIEENKKKEEEAAKKAEKERKVYYPVIEYAKEEWEKAYNVAEDHRFKYESRAVIMDDDIIFISASDALRYLNINTKTSDKVYEVCEIPRKNHQVYAGHEWEYATKADIQKVLDRFEVVNDTK